MTPALDLSPLQRARETRFFQAFQQIVYDGLEAGVDDVPTRALRERVLGREEEFVREVVLPAVRPKVRPAMPRILAADRDREWLTLLCLIHAMADGSPWLIGTELFKPYSEALERKLLRNALDYLRPETFRVIHGGARADEDSLRAAHAAVLEAPSSLDYGCSFGAMPATFAGEFEAHGADLPDGSLRGRLERAIVSLRAHADPEAALDAEGRIRLDRHHLLDLHPGPDSPPRDGSFSVVTSNGVLEHITDHEVLAAVIAKMCRLLRPGGLLLINCLPTWLGYDPHFGISPWWGVLLHRTPRLRQAYFAGRWREGYTRRVAYSTLVKALPPEMLPPISLTGQERRGPTGALVRAAACLHLAPAHYLAIPRRC